MIAYFKTEIPFLRLILFFIAGISISIIYNLHPAPFWIYLWITIFITIIFLSIFYKENKLYLHSYFSGVLIYMLLFLSGIILCNQNKEIDQTHHFSKQKSDQLMAYLIEEPRLKGDIARFKVEIKSIVHQNKITKSSGKLLLAMRFDTTQQLNLHYGDLLLFKSNYKETEPAYNPAEFNYKRYLSFQQVYHQSFINQKQLMKIGENEGNPIKAFALKFRAEQVETFKKYLSRNDTKAVASTLILGYRNDLSNDIVEAYSKTGTMHVLSVSGMHVAIVALLLSFLLRFMDKSKKGRIAKAIFIITLIWFYALIAGLAPSIERAAIMLSFVLIAKASAKRVNIFNVIAIAAFILLISDPFNITNVGFQLSFIAVSGLIYLQPKISSLYEPKNKIIIFLWSVIAVSIAAQIATAPISLYYFHQFPVYFVISNLFIVVPATLIMYLGIGLLIFSGFEPLARVLGYLLNALIDFTNNGLFLIEQINHANITQIWWNVTEIALFYAILILFLKSITNKFYLKFAFALMGVFILKLSVDEFKHIHQKQVTFFSLRKNTAIALIKGRNATLITDLDSNEYTYQFSIKPYLDSCHIQYIKYVNPHLNQDEKIFNFADKKLKIINHKSNNFDSSTVDWLLLSGDKSFDMDKVLAVNHIKELFIDGKNRDFVIDNLEQQLSKHQQPYYVLKRNYAVEIKLD